MHDFSSFPPSLARRITDSAHARVRTAIKHGTQHTMKTRVHNTFGNLPYFIAHLMTVSLRVTEKKEIEARLRTVSTHLFLFFLHIHVIHEKKKKLINSTSFFHKRTTISQDNNTLADDLVLGKEKIIKDIAATVPQRKPEHWREQAISCGPSMAMRSRRKAFGLTNCSELGRKPTASQEAAS